MILENPKNGAPIKNYFIGGKYWSLDVSERKDFPDDVGKYLLQIYGFLIKVEPVKSKGDAETLTPAHTEKPTEGGSPEVVPAVKTVSQEEAKTTEPAKEVKPNLDELNKGELLRLAVSDEVGLDEKQIPKDITADRLRSMIRSKLNL